MLKRSWNLGWITVVCPTLGTNKVSKTKLECTKCHLTGTNFTTDSIIFRVYKWLQKTLLFVLAFIYLFSVIFIFNFFLNKLCYKFNRNSLPSAIPISILVHSWSLYRLFRKSSIYHLFCHNALVKLNSLVCIWFFVFYF
jgi:hypothetical protein